MANLIPLSDLARDRNYDFRSEGIYDPTGDAAYGSDGKKIGTVRGAMVEPDTGRLRYLIVDVGGWFVSKEVLVPVGLARIEDDAVYFDNLTKEQVRDMREYRYGEEYSYDAQENDERVLRGGSYNEKVEYRNDQDLIPTDTTRTTTDRDLAMTGSSDLSEEGTMRPGYNVESADVMSRNTSMDSSNLTTGDATRTGAGTMTGSTDMAGTGVSSRQYNYRDEDTTDALFKTPERLRLMEERLLVDKERHRVGSVEIGKHVENRQEQVNVNLAHEELIIERHPVTDPRPVEGNVQLGADREAIRVDLEAERAHVEKQAFVTEEVEIREREVSETQTFTETVGREVLDVNQTGDVNVRDGNMTGRVAGRDDRDLLDRDVDATGTNRLDDTLDQDRNRNR